MKKKLSISIGVIGIILLVLFAFFSHNKLQKISETRMLMGTFVTITAYILPDQLNIIKKAFNLIKELDELLGYRYQTSIVSLLNKKKEITSKEKGFKDLVNLIFLSRKAVTLTDGAFNPLVAVLLDLYGFYNEVYQVPFDYEIRQVLPECRFNNLCLLGNKVKLLNNAKVDFGGVAKGYIVDRAAEYLKKNGITHAIINAGGDIRIVGPKPNFLPWKFLVRSPDKEGFCGIIILREGAVATSGDYERYFEENGVRYHHLISPFTGKPARKSRSCTVIENSLALADALATGFFIQGKNFSKLKVHRVFIIDSQNNYVVTKSMKEVLNLYKSENL